MKYLPLILLLTTLSCAPEKPTAPRVALPFQTFTLHLGEPFDAITQTIALEPLQYDRHIATANYLKDDSFCATTFPYNDETYQLHAAVRVFNFNRNAELVRVNMIWTDIDKPIPKQATGSMIQSLSNQHFDLQSRFHFPTVIKLPYEEKREYPHYYEWIKNDHEFINYQMAYRGYGFEDGSYREHHRTKQGKGLRH